MGPGQMQGQDGLAGSCKPVFLPVASDFREVQFCVN